MIYEMKKPAAEFIPSMEKISLTDIKQACPLFPFKSFTGSFLGKHRCCIWVSSS